MNISKQTIEDAAELLAHRDNLPYDLHQRYYQGQVYAVLDTVLAAVGIEYEVTE